MAVIGIEYEAIRDKKKRTVIYKAVTLSVRSKKKNGASLNKKFNTGDFIKDWYDALAYRQNECEHDPMLIGSSAVDHFFMDGAEYQSAYLHFVEELYVDEKGKAQKKHNLVLKYAEDANNSDAQGVIDGIEFFIPKGARWTWEQYKDYVKKGRVPDAPVRAKSKPKKKAVKVHN